jgi:hypothetical protein
MLGVVALETVSPPWIKYFIIDDLNGVKRNTPGKLMRFPKMCCTLVFITFDLPSVSPIFSILMKKTKTMCKQVTV